MNVASHEVMSDSDLLLKAEGIQKSYGGVLALYDGCMKLRAGTVHALCGGNGAGKSTFLNILMGLEAPDSGRIWLNGSETRQLLLPRTKTTSPQTRGIPAPLSAAPYPNVGRY